MQQGKRRPAEEIERCFPESDSFTNQQQGNGIDGLSSFSPVLDPNAAPFLPQSEPLIGQDSFFPTAPGMSTKPRPPVQSRDDGHLVYYGPRQMMREPSIGQFPQGQPMEAEESDQWVEVLQLGLNMIELTPKEPSTDNKHCYTKVSIHMCIHGQQDPPRG